jgi:hypothetical protein
MFYQQFNLTEQEKILIDDKVSANRRRVRKIFTQNRSKFCKGLVFGVAVFSIVSLRNLDAAYASERLEKIPPHASKLVALEKSAPVKPGRLIWLKKVWLHTAGNVWFISGAIISGTFLILIFSYFESKREIPPFYVVTEADIKEWLNFTLVDREPWGF